MLLKILGVTKRPLLNFDVWRLQASPSGLRLITAPLVSGASLLHPSITSPHTEDEEEVAGGRRTEEVEMFEAKTAGCMDRKQRLFLSAYQDWVQPSRLDQRGAPCIYL